MIESLQEFAGSFPDWLQWAGVLLIGAVPFIDSYFGSVIGIAIGVSPVIAIAAAILGNIASMLVFVYGTSAARQKVRRGRAAKRAAAALPAETQRADAAAAGESEVASEAAAGAGAETGPGVEPDPGAAAAPVSAKQARLRRWFDRFGIPGVSILGPLVLPSQFTSLAMVGFGADRKAVIIWQVISIVLWGVAFGVLATLGVHIALR